MRSYSAFYLLDAEWKGNKNDVQVKSRAYIVVGLSQIRFNPFTTTSLDPVALLSGQEKSCTPVNATVYMTKNDSTTSEPKARSNATRAKKKKAKKEKERKKERKKKGRAKGVASRWRPDPCEPRENKNFEKTK